MSSLRRSVQQLRSAAYVHRRGIAYALIGGFTVWSVGITGYYYMVARPILLDNLRREKKYFTLPPRRTFMYVAGDNGNASLELNDSCGDLFLLPEEKQRVAEREAERLGSSSAAWLAHSLHATWHVFFYQYVYTAYRMVLVCVRLIPVCWYGILCYYFHTCQEEVLFDAMRQFLSSMGPSYIKLGQWMASRPDMFPKGLCQHLESLFDKTPPHSWRHTQAALKKAHVVADMGDSGSSNGCVWDYLAEVERAPLNSGSIAQVHLARLKRDMNSVSSATDTVIIKVTHPLIREMVQADLRAMRLFASVGQMLFPSLKYFDFDSSLREFSLLLQSQLNLLVEADNLQQFYLNFKDVDGIVVPRVVPALCSRDILIETFEEGTPAQQMTCAPENHDIAKLGCHMFLKMLFEDNFVHSDLHPGNVLVRDNTQLLRELDAQQQQQQQQQRGQLARGRNGPYFYPNGKRKLKRELIILDAGLVTSLSPSERNNFISLFAAVATGDGELGADLMLDRLPPELKAEARDGTAAPAAAELNSTSHSSGKDGKPAPAGVTPEKRAKFRADMKKIFDLVNPEKNLQFTLKEVHIGDVLGKIMTTVRENQTPLDGHFSSLVLTVIVGEGLGRQLVPDFNIFAEAAPYLVAYLKGGELAFVAAKLQSTYGATQLLRHADKAADESAGRSLAVKYARRGVLFVGRIHERIWGNDV